MPNIVGGTQPSLIYTLTLVYRDPVALVGRLLSAGANMEADREGVGLSMAILRPHDIIARRNHD